MFHYSETEVSRTYKLHFEKPVIATHPQHKDQELAFTDATITLCAFWDPQSQSWKAKKNPNGAPAALELHAPRAKRFRQGRVTKLDAFHNGGKLIPVPIRLDLIQKRDWDDDVQERIRTSIVSAFWTEVLAR